MADSSTKYYQFVYYTVDPGSYGLFEVFLKKKLLNFTEKSSTKLFGVYKAAVGAVGEYLLILEQDNPQQCLLDDKAYQELHACFDKMISNVTVYVTKCLPFYPLLPADPKHMISIRRYDIKGNPYEAVQDFKACNDVVYDKHIRSHGVTLIGAFIPVFGENTNAYFALWDLTGPNAMASNEEIGKAILMDRSVKELTKKMWDHVIGVSSKYFISVEVED